MPISPPLDSLPYNREPKKKKSLAIFLALFFGTILTVVLDLILGQFQISINFWPILFPIWLGFVILIYSISPKND
ncbi:MAG: hypothetical protein WC508_00815 [Patescibacteria group bacterium]